MAVAAVPIAAQREAWYSSMAGVIVAGLGLLVLFGVVAIALLTLPENETKSQNVIAVASSAFGVIGTIVGAYFGVRAANRAVDKMQKSL
jgi:Na+/phosphate symporter